MTDGRRTGRWTWLAGTVPVTLAVVAFSVQQTTLSAFRSTTPNTGNRLAAGTVSLSDDDSATKMFSATGLQRGDSASKCIVVTYNGSLAASVKLYVTASSGTLASYLDLTIDEGSGGSFAGGCGGFTTSSTIYTGTLASFASTKTDFASGVGSWNPGGSGQTRTYRITYTLNVSAPSSAGNTSATADLRWEARNT